eukprot:CAMPEP_0167748324 /NCGR_PEP_ID=MMETSP0110_2-20121227/4776_1 /TAXON_ID=629695 /ORGANISM="Gymnochlora sp., Strain CCMP2014" /LENGTH=93 /DNA_ID=CAMNT_0007633329 /DNA_START=658 /DNA_END=939 /DNA_ORIENTATION=+
MGIYALVPVIHWAALVPIEESKVFLVGVFKMLGSYGIGVIFFLSKYPEKAFPGYFDTFLTSHQIWHVAVAYACWAWFETLTAIYDYRETHGCE